jgi:AcrR family transcriptional regulator
MSPAAVAAKPLTPRQRARLSTLDEIKRVARHQLATEGSSGLSLRAIARELGVVSSAVYRYVPSRDELLTILITEAYDALGAAVEAAEAAKRRDDFLGRWFAAGRAVRHWALEHASEYALIYGSPVPGYHAPAERTVGPATRVALVLTHLLADLQAAGAVTPDGTLPPPKAVAAEMHGLTETLGLDVSPELMARGLAAWMALYGMVSFELFGQLDNVIEHRDAHFDHQLRRLWTLIGMGA